ncbi:hypothetical protein ElyMa_000227300 [Elysia marginata]|uniref:Uncharacterized protein n=1 Tax=Elysia marginata TaxID=1093978 RepID=A0AAV4F0E5_9GAST|nr:hypothetical protein ElyMa_000227300 [Elysia marginata]
MLWRIGGIYDHNILTSTMESNRILGGQCGRVVSASDSRSGRRGFDSRPCHVAVALGEQFTLTFLSPPTCKMGTQLQAILEFVICACNTLHMGSLKCTGLVGH